MRIDMAEVTKPTEVQEVAVPATPMRGKVSERLKTKYPDKEFADDEAMFGQISDDYDDYDNRIGEYKNREKALTDMFASDPRSAYFLSNWRNGEDPVVGLVRQFGTDIKDAIDDPKRQQEIAEANKEFVERVAKEKELEETYRQNLDASLTDLAAWQEENGLSDDEVDEAMEFLQSVITDGIMGKFSRESMDMARKAINHDADVADADYEGEVRGKNTRVEEKLRKRSKGDGTSSLDGATGGASKPQPNLGALGQMSNTANIWERGGEKRTKRYRD